MNVFLCLNITAVTMREYQHQENQYTWAFWKIQQISVPKSPRSIDLCSLVCINSIFYIYALVLCICVIYLCNIPFVRHISDDGHKCGWRVWDLLYLWDTLKCLRAFAGFISILDTNCGFQDPQAAEDVLHALLKAMCWTFLFSIIVQETNKL